MKTRIKEKILRVCAEKIAQKGEGVQLSFYAFFANKNDDPALLMEVARWWIEEEQLNHFEKATKIHAMVSALEDNFNDKSQRQNGFNHLTLSVMDLDKSLAFYVDLLGFKGEVRWSKGAYLSYQNCWLCLSLIQGVPEEAMSRHDYTHFAFSYDLDAIQSVRQKEAFQAVTVWQQNTSEGDSLYLQDPDGHKLELHAGSLATRLASLKEKPYDGLLWLS